MARYLLRIRVSKTRVSRNKNRPFRGGIQRLRASGLTAYPLRFWVNVVVVDTSREYMPPGKGCQEEGESPVSTAYSLQGLGEVPRISPTGKAVAQRCYGLQGTSAISLGCRRLCDFNFKSRLFCGQISNPGIYLVQAATVLEVFEKVHLAVDILNSISHVVFLGSRRHNESPHGAPESFRLGYKYLSVISQKRKGAVGAFSQTELEKN